MLRNLFLFVPFLLMLKRLILAFIFVPFLFPSNANAETYVCAFKCYGTEEGPEELCQSVYKRTKNGFLRIGENEQQFEAVEDNNFIVLTFSSTDDQLSELLTVAKAGVVIINKLDGGFIKSFTGYNASVMDSYYSGNALAGIRGSDNYSFLTCSTSLSKSVSGRAFFSRWSLL